MLNSHANAKKVLSLLLKKSLVGRSWVSVRRLTFDPHDRPFSFVGVSAFSILPTGLIRSVHRVRRGRSTAKSLIYFVKIPCPSSFRFWTFCAFSAISFASFSNC